MHYICKENHEQMSLAGRIRSTPMGPELTSHAQMFFNRLI